jgi:hypothetical protein
VRTEDAGLTWTQQASGTTHGLLSVRFITERIGVVAGEHGVLLRTTNGGFPDELIPPETNCKLTGVMEGDVYISNVTVSFTATDNGSGVWYTMFSLDDGSWTTYGEPFLVETEGNHVLRFYSVDNAGNAEQVKTFEFTLSYPPALHVTMKGGLGISVTIANKGSLDVDNVSWSITLDSGLIFFRKHTSGIVNITAGQQVTLRSLVFGVGRPTITLTVNSYETTVDGIVFLLFVRI